jgi:hypothetical protein
MSSVSKMSYHMLNGGVQSPPGAEVSLSAATSRLPVRPAQASVKCYGIRGSFPKDICG